MDLAHRHGAKPLVDRAHDELMRAGARPRRMAVSGVDALTPSERRVAELAAEGMSNKQIAQALFVTLRTVEMHLSGAYRKLGIDSRLKLADALGGGEEGLAACGVRRGSQKSLRQTLRVASRCHGGRRDGGSSA